MYERQVEFLGSHPEIDVLGTGMAIVDRQGGIVGQRLLPAQAFVPGRQPVIAHATICCRREWIQQHPYNEENSRCEDWELWRSAGEVAGQNLEEPLYFYREFDSFTLGKYLGRHARMMQAYARSVDPRAMIGSIVRCAVYTAATLTGMTDRLIARRSEPLSGNRQAELQEIYDSVLRTRSEQGQQAPAARRS